jgi:ubiquinone biosynthesis UbiH/UbiF/VisC/COQ6 family hydroxylase
MEFDVVIVGAGLVGASFAAALADTDLRLGLIAPAAPSAPPDDATWDARIYAVSPGAAQFLQACNAWPAASERIEPVRAMHIFGDARGSEITFDAYDAGLSELAFIAENRRLQYALWQRLTAQRNLQLFCPAHCTGFEWTSDGARVTLADGKQLSTALVVGADGAASWVRTQADLPVVRHSYRQRAVVANFATQRPHDGVAFQWFRQDGVLALLPLPGQRVSAVWSTGEAHAETLLALDDAALGEAVAAAGGGVLGRFETLTPAAAFPLRLQRSRRVVRPRVALIGDAAHNVHPLAGQGVNLGFRDARELARVLMAREAGRDCGDFFLLRRYERARKEDMLAVALVTDGLQKLFSHRSFVVAGARNLGIECVDQWALAKRMLVRHAVA